MIYGLPRADAIFPTAEGGVISSPDQAGWETSWAYMAKCVVDPSSAIKAEQIQGIKAREMVEGRGDAWLDPGRGATDPEHAQLDWTR